MKSWEEAVCLDLGFFLLLPLDLEFSSISTGPDVRWSLLQLGGVYLKFKSLTFVCRLGSEEDLVLSLPRRFKHSLCSCVRTKSLQSCLTLWDHMVCSLPGSSVHGILQARILEWVAMPSCRGIFPNPQLLHLLYWQVGSLPLAPLVIPNQKAGRRLRTFTWKVAARYLRKLEAFRM